MFINQKLDIREAKLDKYMIENIQMQKGRRWCAEGVFLDEGDELDIRLTCRKASRSSPPPPLADTCDTSQGS